MKIGFIGLGNVGGKLAGSLLRNEFNLTVRDLDRATAQPFLDRGAAWADSPKAMAEAVDIVITCLPSPAASAAVMEAEDGLLAGLGPGKVWLEMSTTDAAEIERLAALVQARGALRVTMRDASNPDIGEVTLVFEDQPLALRKWQVVDAQGVLTEVSLVNPQFGVAIKPESFEHQNLGIINPGTRKQDR